MQCVIKSSNILWEINLFYTSFIAFLSIHVQSIIFQLDHSFSYCSLFFNHLKFCKYFLYCKTKISYLILLPQFERWYTDQKAAKLIISLNTTVSASFLSLSNFLFFCFSTPLFWVFLFTAPNWRLPLSLLSAFCSQ
jgi:hypothetical protein